MLGNLHHHTRRTVARAEAQYFDDVRVSECGQLLYFVVGQFISVTDELFHGHLSEVML